MKMFNTTFKYNFNEKNMFYGDYNVNDLFEQKTSNTQMQPIFHFSLT